LRRQTSLAILNYLVYNSHTNKAPRGVLKKGKINLDFSSPLTREAPYPALNATFSRKWRRKSVKNTMANPIQFIKEARSELGKVVWPSRAEVIRITIAVIVLSLAVALFLGLIDYGLTYLFEWAVNKE
jgi:preprotein translocase subunit SecE